ncbi:MAG: D-alanine--D-alanine ligase [Rickettsiales bacterium]|nr:D-alanine--D-alanine ligase [Rickettsiales bacterium]
MVSLKKFKRILILGGGISDERDISHLSANNVSEALKNETRIKLLDVSKNANELISKIQKFRPDVIFNCLHGYFGEDGQIQSILNYLKIPYTHSGVLTSAILMNKIISKKLFKSIGVRTPEFFNEHNIENQKFKFPVIIKPINGGSSRGLIKINNKKSLNKYLKNNRIKKSNMLIEEFIDGREFTVGILENKICGVMEIKFSNELYDYNNKYINIAKHIINPKLPKKIEKELIENSLKVHSSFNCNCISRIDFRYNEETNKTYLLEVNTQPGLTKNSLLPEMAKEKGISFLKLCKILLKSSICEV